MFGARDMAIDLLGVTNETSQSKEAELDQWRTDLQAQAQKLAEDQKNLKKQEQDVLQREAAVKLTQDELDTEKAAYEELMAQLQPNQNDISTVVNVIEKMSADTSAPMLMAMSDTDAMFNLFSRLKPATQAAILETVDAQAAASLLQKLSKINT
jgi:flagellar motility protein MotE (MotC chaperone)